ncbi:MAG: hypothetical protein JWO03_834, partial [Bacteroidetes bacterium]|nr:hypothetical protein [Bacteroidota bacterium]
MAMPYPYMAWLCMSNDPDNTTTDNWTELHEYIWKELELPFGDALFLRSFNQNLPGQVNLADQPHILKAHAHDSLHFWGDYQHARQRAFDRQDAEDAERALAENNFTPRVWVDHSNNRANFIHSANEGTIPAFKDSSGVEYKNFNYSLDIAERVGIKYVWNGTITPYISQDTDLPYASYLKDMGMSRSKRLIYPLLNTAAGNSRLGQFLPSITNDNKQVWSHLFPDGRKLYCFIRYGTWEDADIDGLANIISPSNISKLLERGGTCIAYTHLGKRKPSRANDKQHIPETTRAALKNLKAQYEGKSLMLSSISTMLDYLVIRDNIVIDDTSGTINFKPDGIRFKKLTPEDL